VFNCGVGQLAETVSWDRIITGRGVHTIICGDFNAHGPLWNPHCMDRRNVDFLESIIDRHELTVLNNKTTICSTPGFNLHCIVDLTLVTEDLVGFIKWKVLEEDGYAIGSNHELIEWEFFRELPFKTNNNGICGWAILDLVNDEEKKKEAYQKWLSYTNNRPNQNGSSEVHRLEDEVDWVQQSIIQILDKHGRKIRICPRSKKLWNEKIEERRQELGINKRRQKQGNWSSDNIREK
jgi:hypothetical protein